MEGRKKGSKYKKMPVLDLNGRQINDSFIIIKNLAPILDGKPLTENEVKFEEVMTYQLMMLMEAKMFGNPEDMKNFSTKIPAKWACIFACLCHLRCCGGSIKNKFLKRHNLEDDKPDKFLKMIEDKLGSNNFLGGD